MLVQIEGYKNTEVKLQRNYNGFDVYQGSTTKTKGTKNITVFVHKKQGFTKVVTVNGTTQQTHESFTITF